MNTYLLEIGLEEMPAHMILPAVEQLKKHAKKTCEDCQLGDVDIQTFSTPRRLAVKLAGLPTKQEDRIIELKGPPIAIAKNDDGSWSKAAMGFAKKNQLSTDHLEIREFQGKDYLFAKRLEEGLPVQDLLKSQIEQWITQLNFPKNMRWGAYRMRFIRPIRWILSLWNDEVVPLKLEMVEASHATRGHRFLSRGINILNGASDYEPQLRRLFVIVNFQKRKEIIVSQVKKLEKEHGFEVKLDEKLLNEVTNLLEWPTVILGTFEKDFLELPSEVLVTSMAVHQRYFPVYEKAEQKSENKNDRYQKLLPNFVTVRNGNERALEKVQRGNEKVLRARLSDAKFFYQEDQKVALETFCQKAERVVFFQKRGTQAQRVERIEALSLCIAKKLNLSKEQQHITARIAKLSKFDLDTQMVNEFPELQGLMGAEYARLKKEEDLICRGIQQHYLPKNSQDSLPENIETAPVAIADKLDMLITAFSLNMIPTGAADPYALRRMAQGITQLIMGLNLTLSPKELITEAVNILEEQQDLDLNKAVLQQKLEDFFVQRQRWFLQEQGIRYDLIDAVLQSQTDNHDIETLPVEQYNFSVFINKHLDAESFKSSVEAVVRAINISTKYSEKISETIHEANLTLVEEKKFYDSLKTIIAADSQSRLSPEEYLDQLNSIQPVVTKFFDEVMVMDEDPVKCGQRLWLCHQLAKWSGKHLDVRALVFS